MKPLLAFVLFSAVVFGQALFNQEPQIRVLLINSPDTLDIVTRGPWSLRNTGSATMKLPENSTVRFINGGGQISMYDPRGALMAKTPSFMLGSWSDTAGISLSKRSTTGKSQKAPVAPHFYPGQLHIYLGSDQEMNTVLQLPLEDYIKEVLPYELSPDVSLAVLQAKAIVIRSQAVFALTQPSQDGIFYHLRFRGYDQNLTDHVHPTRLTDQAVDETAGLILTENGRPVGSYLGSPLSSMRGDTSFEKILSHYYPQAKVTNTYTP